MARALPARIGRERPVKGAVGRKILETITAGMYSDPLMSLREYIQNAADAVDAAVARGLIAPGDERISVSVSGRDRSIAVEDNGCGISRRRVERVLCGLGHSEKQSSFHRGFRGIGRLGGLAYCKRLVFATRSASKEMVTEVEWDGSRLRRVVDDTSHSASLASAITELARIRTRKARTDEPAHFFRVRMEDVSRFHDDSLLNLGALGRYLSLVAPVPYDAARFSFSSLLQDHLSGVPGWRSYQVYLNGRQILKPYRDEMQVSDTKSDCVTGVELFEVTDVDGSLVGRGWYGLTGLLGAIPPTEPMRGIRVRQGNMGVGDERFLEQMFAEPRFAVWHIGEVELVLSVRPNARRDGFEQASGYERLLAYMSLVGRKLSSKCRASSRYRSRGRRLASVLAKVEQLLSSFPVFIDHDHARSVAAKASMLLGEVRPAAMDGLKNTDVGRRYRALLLMLRAARKHPPVMSDCIDGRLLGKGCTKGFLEGLCRRIIDGRGTDEVAATALSRVLTPYLKGHLRTAPDGRSASGVRSDRRRR